MALHNYTLHEELSDASKEAYNVLSTNIQFFDLDKKLNTITITSYGPGEGKTTTSINLSIFMARAGYKVLYIDADLRKPMLMKSLGDNNFKGLSNYLLGRATQEEIIYDTNIGGFYFITCGVKPLNPIELLGTVRFKTFLKTIALEYDYVIIDTPPLGSVIDSAIIAAQTAGTLIVIEPGKVKFDNALMMKEQLEKANVTILGVVMNKVDKIDYKNYYTGYDYYGEKRKYAKGWLQKHKKSKKV